MSNNQTTMIKLPIVIDGVEYNSIASASKACGIAVSTVKNRIYRGWTDVDKIFKTGASETQHLKLPLVEGRQFNNLREASRFYGVDYHLVHQRYKKQGWSLEEALGIVERIIPRNNTVSISVFGKEYNSIQDAYNDIKPKDKTYSQVRYSLKIGNSPEVAFSDYVSPNTFIVQGVDYGTARNAAKHFNVCFDTVRYRLKNGWTNEEAVGLEPP